ncbi:DUF2478 domain-containing protein [Aestuariibius sp. HNIBRBA575]|uniref:DUF2478 domain-containing protein n=1 Tax=Aestuariibius sp. HNIBRBA575 TaxID=3233343 RepID=UPI0034A1E2C3
MKLAYIMSSRRGGTDRVLGEFAALCEQQGVKLAGVVQTNTECAPSHLCDMDVRVLPDGPVLRISQSLGAGSKGCRLDASVLEEAVGHANASLSDDAQLLLINKFGKREAEGHGFRAVISDAVLRGIPVVLGVNDANLAAFLDYADGMADRLNDNVDDLQKWYSKNAT